MRSPFFLQSFCGGGGQLRTLLLLPKNILLRFLFVLCPVCVICLSGNFCFLFSVVICSLVRIFFCFFRLFLFLLFLNLRAGGKRKFFCSNVLLSLNYTHSLFLSCLSILYCWDIDSIWSSSFWFYFIFLRHLFHFHCRHSHSEVLIPFRHSLLSFFCSQIFAQNSENICLVVTYVWLPIPVIIIISFVRERWCVPIVNIIFPLSTAFLLYAHHRAFFRWVSMTTTTISHCSDLLWGLFI